MSAGPEFWRRGPTRRLGKRAEVMFGQVREDTALESILARGRCLCIASGGETAFDLLLGGAETVHAVDINPAQTWLVELKAAIVKTLPYEDGLDAMTTNAAAAFKEVEETLSLDSRSYFARRPSALAKGLQNCGRVDALLQRLGVAFRVFVHSRATQLRLFGQLNQPDQDRFFGENWNTLNWKLALGLLSRSSTLRAAFGKRVLLGLTKDELRSFARDIEHVLRKVDLTRNPYVSQAMLGEYRAEGLPGWLTREGYAAVGGRLDRLTLETADVADVLEAANQPYDLLCLSNVLDVTDPAYPDRLVKALLKGTRPGSLVIARSFFPFPASSRPGRANLVELSQGALAARELPPWTDRSFFCRNVSLMEVCA